MSAAAEFGAGNSSTQLWGSCPKKRLFGEQQLKRAAGAWPSHEHRNPKIKAFSPKLTDKAFKRESFLLSTCWSICGVFELLKTFYPHHQITKKKKKKGGILIKLVSEISL